MSDPHPNLTRALIESYKRAHSEAGYHAPWFAEMIHDRFGYDTATYLIRSTQPSKGFTNLWERKRLDLTVEALIIRPEWAPLFSEDDLQRAHKRLLEYHYTPPPDSWAPGQSIARSTSPPASPEARDIASASTDRIATTVYRILRDTEVARRVKMIHDYQCQICGHTIVFPDGRRYAEAHHIQPLGQPHNGPDILENLLCLCPNHHAELDYLVVPLRLESLRILPAHPVGVEYLKYHNQQHHENGGA